jgi:hypothetical protein
MAQPPSRWQLLRHELAARRGIDLLLAALLLIPVLSDWLRPRLKSRMVCAFLGIEDAEERRLGCLLHPTRWEGTELRPASAFRLLRGFGCGSPRYLCSAAHRFAAARAEQVREFARQVAGMDWYHYSRAAPRFRARSVDSIA